MIKDVNPRYAVVLDLDGTIIERPLERLARVKDIFEPSRIPDLSLAEIKALSMDHLPTPSPVSIRRRLIAGIGSRRRLFPGVSDDLKRRFAEGATLLVNTARPNESDIHDMTEKSLQAEGILPLIDRIYYRPEGIDPAVSKAHAILDIAKMHEKIEIFENNQGIAIYLARLFPDARINLIQTERCGFLFLRSEAVELPNLRRVASMVEVRQ